MDCQEQTWQSKTKRKNRNMVSTNFVFLLKYKKWYWRKKRATKDYVWVTSNDEMRKFGQFNSWLVDEKSVKPCFLRIVCGLHGFSSGLFTVFKGCRSSNFIDRWPLTEPWMQFGWFNKYTNTIFQMHKIGKIIVLPS